MEEYPNNNLDLIARDSALFLHDIYSRENELSEIIKGSSFLIVGGAGSIGQAVVKEIFKRNPRIIHVVDLSENNLVELVRDLRSSHGYIKGDFKTFALDTDSPEFDCFLQTNKNYDYVFNLSALKHVRSERDPYTLMRMTRVNIFNARTLAEYCVKNKTKKYFCVSSDKATNPENLMGASKRIMELFLLKNSEDYIVSLARFANVAFSDGSLLHGFNQRMKKKQPIAAPTDVKRYFLTSQESGELCLLSGIFGENRDVYFPKLDENKNTTSFSDIAKKYLHNHGYEPAVFETEEQAREKAVDLIKVGKWPCYFFISDTTGEKYIEEFSTHEDLVDMNKYIDIGIIKQGEISASVKEKLQQFDNKINGMIQSGIWSKHDIVCAYSDVIPELHHVEKGKSLDEKM
jgi:FlaA1/EpsC-like NDP-sugar epimerase